MPAMKPGWVVMVLVGPGEERNEEDGAAIDETMGEAEGMWNVDAGEVVREEDEEKED